MSSQNEKVENEAADIPTAPSAVLAPISELEVKHECNPAVEIEASDSLLVITMPCYLSVPPLSRLPR